MLPLANLWGPQDWSGFWVVIYASVLFGLELRFIPTEGYLMKRCKWGTLIRSTSDAAIANIILVVSTFLLAINIAPLPTELPYLLSVLILWAWSVLVKGIWLTLTHRHPAPQIWRTVLTVNTAIYAVGGVIVALLFRPRLF